MRPSSRGPRPIQLCLLLIAVCSGCGKGSLDPAATGGTALEGTRGAAVQGGAPFAISPDGRWLSFALDFALPADVDDEPAALARYELDRLRHFRLYGLDSGTLVQPEVSPEAEAFVLGGGFPLTGAGCWMGARLVLRTAHRRPLVTVAAERTPTWRPGPQNVRLAGCPFPDRRPLQSGNYGPVRLLVGDGDRVAVSERRSGRELAVHKPGGLPGMSLQVPYLEVSADGRHVAYGVLDHFGSFVGNTTAYLLNLTDAAGPRALGAPVLFLRWAPDGAALYGYAGLAEKGATRYAIYRWTVSK